MTAQAVTHLVQPVTVLTITAMLPSGRDWHQLTRSKPSSSDGQGGAVAGTGNAHGRNAGQRPGIGTGSDAQAVAPSAAGHGADDHRHDARR